MPEETVVELSYVISASDQYYLYIVTQSAAFLFAGIDL